VEVTALHITIHHKGANRFEVTCDNLRREDASPEEIAMANILERLELEAFKMIADEMISQSIHQEGPAAAPDA
jgi:hypothetical protein